MGDFRVSGACGVYFVLLCVIRPALNTGIGKCPVYPQLPNFDITRMAGTWYEVERSFYLMELSASCTELHLDVNGKGQVLITINTINRWLGNPSTTYGLGIPSFNGSSVIRYKLNNRMPYIIGRLLPGAGLYNVLFTDYERFALIWSCTSISVAHSDRIWVLGREREFEVELRARIYMLMSELRLDPDRLILSKNNNCTNATDRAPHVINKAI